MSAVTQTVFNPYCFFVITLRLAELMQTASMMQTESKVQRDIGVLEQYFKQKQDHCNRQAGLKIKGNMNARARQQVQVSLLRQPWTFSS